MAILLWGSTTWAQTDQSGADNESASRSGSVTMLGTYYADRFVGRKTSCGEIFRQNQYTAAHKRIPMGTYLLVTYPVTNKQIVVRVNDRCPKPGILDMTKLAVHALGINGSGRVVVTTLDAETGYRMWSIQDTLAMSEEEYYAFRDRSRPKRISPYPISPTDEENDVQAPKPAKKKKKGGVNTPSTNKIKAGETPDTTETLLQPAAPTHVEELPAVKTGALYDIELCIVNTQVAAQREAGRLPKELQDKALFRRNQLNNQVHVILAIADSRSHAVRTQAMLIDEFPDSCLIPHEQ